jgi:hypothetical protein
MEAVNSFETSGKFHRSTRRQTAEYSVSYKTEEPAVLTEVFRGLLQSLLANSRIMSCKGHQQNRDSSVSIAIRLEGENWGIWFQFQSMKKRLLFFKTSRPALGSTQPQIEWVQSVLSLGLKAARGGRSLLASIYCRDKMHEAIILFSHSPACLCAQSQVQCCI